MSENTIRKKHTGEPGNGGQFGSRAKSEPATINPWDTYRQARDAIVAQELEYLDTLIREEFPDITELKYRVEPGDYPGDSALYFFDAKDSNGDSLTAEDLYDLDDATWDVVSSVTRNEIESPSFGESQPNAKVYRSEFTREWIVDYSWTRDSLAPAAPESLTAGARVYFTDPDDGQSSGWYGVVDDATDADEDTPVALVGSTGNHVEALVSELGVKKA